MALLRKSGPANIKPASRPSSGWPQHLPDFQEMLIGKRRK